VHNSGVLLSVHKLFKWLSCITSQKRPIRLYIPHVADVGLLQIQSVIAKSDKQ